MAARRNTSGRNQRSYGNGGYQIEYTAGSSVPRREASSYRSSRMERAQAYQNRIESDRAYRSAAYGSGSSAGPQQQGRRQTSAKQGRRSTGQASARQVNGTGRRSTVQQANGTGRQRTVQQANGAGRQRSAQQTGRTAAAQTRAKSGRRASKRTAAQTRMNSRQEEARRTQQKRRGQQTQVYGGASAVQNSRRMASGYGYYDYSASPAYRPEEPAERPLTEEEKKRALRRKRIIQRNQQRYLSMNPGYFICLAVSVVLLCAFGSMMIQKQAEVQANMDKVVAMELQLSELKQANDREESAIYSGANLNSIKKDVKEMGMTYVESGQVVYYTLDDSDYVNEFSALK